MRERIEPSMRSSPTVTLRPPTRSSTDVDVDVHLPAVLARQRRLEPVVLGAVSGVAVRTCATRRLRSSAATLAKSATVSVTRPARGAATARLDEVGGGRRRPARR